MSVRCWDADFLPYSENTVNLVVISAAKSPIKTDEIRRVLAPRGVCVGPDKKKSFTKPVQWADIATQEVS